MTEYWVSAEKHYCKVCNVWCKAGKRAVINHEEGKQHKEKLKLWLKANRQREKDNDEAKEEIKRIEAKALATMEEDARLFSKVTEPTLAPDADLTTGGSSSSTHTVPQSTHTVPQSTDPDEPRPKRAKTSEQATLPTKNGKKKPLWKACVDPNTQQTYYYNRETKASVWEKPADFSAAAEEPPPKAKTENDVPQVKTQVKEEVPAELKREKAKKKPLWKACVDPNTQQTYYYNRETKASVWEKPADFSAAAEETSPKAKNEDDLQQVKTQVKEEVPAELKREKTKKKPLWKACVDPNTQQTYYYNRETKASVWEKPADFSAAAAETSPKAKNAAEHSQVKVEVKNEEPQEPKTKAKRPTWRMVYDEKKKTCRYINRKTGKTEQERPEDFDGREVQLNADGTLVKQEVERKVEDVESEPGVVVKKDGVGAVGMWEEVAADESAFAGTQLPREESSDSEADIERIAAMPEEERSREAAYLIAKYQSDAAQVVAEDLIARDIEMVDKESTRATGDVTFKSRTKRGQRRQHDDSD